MDRSKQISIQVSAIILPFSVVIMIPAILLAFTYQRFSWKLGFPSILIPVISGCILITSGIYLLAYTNWLFYRIGKGTLAPWAPTKKIVTTGPYRHIRNPMIGAVLVVLLGEAIATGSMILLIWFIVFFAGNIIYFIYVEEPALVKRFGDKYRNYKKRVPMLFPKPGKRL